MKLKEVGGICPSFTKVVPHWLTNDETHELIPLECVEIVVKEEEGGNAATPLGKSVSPLSTGICPKEVPEVKSTPLLSELESVLMQVTADGLTAQGSHVFSEVVTWLEDSLLPLKFT